LAWVAPDYLFSRDAFSAFKIASWVQSKGRGYQLMSVSQTNYSRLRHAPLVAIGAFNNSWAMRVTAELRFVFDRRTIDGVTYNCINDRRNPSAVNWMVKQPPAGAMTEDYAIVTRVFDPSTEKTVISVAGIEAYGTLAAGEFVTEPEYVGVTLAAAPRGWRHKNIQFVLTTKIIDGTPGPPRVLPPTCGDPSFRTSLALTRTIVCWLSVDKIPRWLEISNLRFYSSARRSYVTPC
jgi:hypothetical protein